MNQDPVRKRLVTDPRLWVVIGIAVAVRAYYYSSFMSSPFAGYNRVDHDYYRTWAMRLASGDWLGQEVFEQAPLYPYLLGILFHGVGSFDQAALVCQFAVGVAGCCLLFICGQRLFDGRTALLAGLVAATFGPLVFYECMIMKTFLSPFLTILALYFGLRYADERNPKWIAAAGVSVGVACLVRENHVLLLVGLAVWVWAARPWPCHVSGEGAEKVPPMCRTRLGLHLLYLFLGFITAIIPCTIRNYAVSGEFVLVTAGGGEVFYMAHGPHANGYYEPPPFVSPDPFREHEDFRKEAERRVGHELTRSQSSRYWFGEAFNEAWRHPIRTAQLMVFKASSTLNDFEVPDSQYYLVTGDFIPFLNILPTFGWISGLGLLGLVLCLRQPKRYSLLLLFVGGHFFSILLTYGFGRFRSGLAPLWILLAAWGAIRLWDQAVSLFKTNETPGDQSDRRAAIAKPAFALAGVGFVTWLAFQPPLNYSATTYDFDRYAFRFRIEMREGELRQAEKTIRAALATNPPTKQAATAHRALAELLHEDGKLNSAKKEYLAALQHNPRDSQSLAGLGAIHEKQGDPQRGMELYQRAIKFDPRNSAAHYCLARAYKQRGEAALAVDHYRSFLSLQPDSPNTAAELAWLLATAEDSEIRNGAEALRLATFANQATEGKNPIVLDALAAAFAEQGMFTDAIIMGEQALQRAGSDPTLAPPLSQRLSLYRQGRPARGAQIPQ